jgi:hypothetical protein
MDERERRHQGAHYTTEKNIMKVIQPLFLDDLRAEFKKPGGGSHRWWITMRLPPAPVNPRWSFCALNFCVISGGPRSLRAHRLYCAILMENLPPGPVAQKSAFTPVVSAASD